MIFILKKDFFKLTFEFLIIIFNFKFLLAAILFLKYFIFAQVNLLEDFFPWFHSYKLIIQQRFLLKFNSFFHLDYAFRLKDFTFLIAFN